jgi:hypothetical protein
MSLRDPHGGRAAVEAAPDHQWQYFPFAARSYPGPGGLKNSQGHHFLQTPDPQTFTLRGAPPRLEPDAYFDGITRYVQTNLQTPESPTRIHIKFLDTTPHPFLVPHKPMHIVEGKTAMRQELLRWAERLLDGLEQAPSRQVLEQAIARHQPGRWQLIPLHPKLVLETFPLDSWGNGEVAR